MQDSVVLLEDQAIEVLSYWGLKPGNWRTVGLVTSGLEGISRPIIEIAGERYVLRRQPPDLTENDTFFRHTFMRYLREQGIPVPPLLARPDGRTYAVLPDGIYELQGWLDGRRYVSGGPDSDDDLEAAARTLGQFHQASAGFQWQPHVWSEERSGPAIAQAYIELIQQRAESGVLAPAIAAGLTRTAAQCRERLDIAVEALDVQPGPPELHIHGDYQAYNLAFGARGVTAIYDFNATRWGRRVDELAYSLLYFTGVRWDDPPTVTPPLTEEGLDVARAQRFLSAYGEEAPPAEGEARLLADALALAFPVAFANGVAEDLTFPEDFTEPPDETDALSRLHWVDTFWLWLDRYRDMLAEVWERGG